MTPFRRLISMTALGACLALAACDGPQRTVDRLRTEIATFKSTPTDASQETIDADFDRLDAQIARLDQQNKTAEAAKYQSAAENLRSEYRTAKMVRSIKDAQSAVRGIGEALKDAGQSIGEAFRSAEPTPTP